MEDGSVGMGVFAGVGEGVSIGVGSICAGAWGDCELWIVEEPSPLPSPTCGTSGGEIRFWAHAGEGVAARVLGAGVEVASAED